MCFWLGILMIGRISGAFILLMELSQSKHRAFTGTVLMIGDALAVIYVDVWYRLVPYTTPLVWFCLVLNILSFITAFWIPESPSWLLTQGRSEEASQAIDLIAKFNGKNALKIRKFKKESGEATEASTTPRWSCLVCTNLAFMTLNWTGSSFDYYLISFYMKYIPGSIFVNTAISSLAEITALICSGFAMQHLGFKASFVLGFSLAAIGGFCIAFVDPDGLAIVIFILVAKAGISFAFQISYLAMPLLFPVEIRSTCFGVVNIFARCATVLSPIIAEVNAPTPMVIYGILAAACAVCSLSLRPNDEKKKIVADDRSPLLETTSQ